MNTDSKDTTGIVNMDPPGRRVLRFLRRRCDGGASKKVIICPRRTVAGIALIVRFRVTRVDRRQLSNEIGCTARGLGRFPQSLEKIVLNNPESFKDQLGGYATVRNPDTSQCDDVGRFAGAGLSVDAGSYPSSSNVSPTFGCVPAHLSIEFRLASCRPATCDGWQRGADIPFGHCQLRYLRGGWCNQPVAEAMAFARVVSCRGTLPDSVGDARAREGHERNRDAGVAHPHAVDVRATPLIRPNCEAANDSRLPMFRW